MSEFNILKQLVSDGVELTYGKMTLCDLSHYQTFRGDKKWQIYCSDKRIKEGEDNKNEGFYKVYDDLSKAIMKFLELKMKISNRVR